ncbi:SPOR domain-containing protein [Trichloromonas sp.]|uniref:SPOR domain-containing protein n=1 Tax=Trichloromonas sp. TaxID=3069249 RepID=UPI003D812736
MVHQVKSRTQRRMEKKQAILLVVLLLGISLVSFFLGIMVGRSGSTPAAISTETATRPLPVAPKPLEPPKAEVLVESEPEPEPAPEQKKEGLTFYDALPKGEQPPLGSGINLPPEAQPVTKPESQPAAVEPVAAVPAKPVEAAAVPLPKAVPQGAYVVQVASFQQLPDATGLRDRLAKKGYAAFTQEADLGSKGVWHRVMVGPYAGSEAAGQAAEHLKLQEKLAGIVKKQ